MNCNFCNNFKFGLGFGIGSFLASAVSRPLFGFSQMPTWWGCNSWNVDWLTSPFTAMYMWAANNRNNGLNFDNSFNFNSNSQYNNTSIFNNFSSELTVNNSWTNFDTFTPTFNNATFVDYTFPQTNWYNTSGNGTSSIKDKKETASLKPLGSNAKEYGQRMVENATHYVGKVNDDATGNKLFSGGVDRQWCADFATAISKESFGSKLPANFGKAKRNGVSYGTSQVYGLMYWAQDNDCYLGLPQNKGAQAKAGFIAQNVKPGDLMIQKENGASHTGVVTKVNADGSFETVEGNCSDSVKTCHYKADDSKLTGFVSMGRIA